MTAEAAAPAEVFLVFRPRAPEQVLRWWQRLWTERHRAHVVALVPAGAGTLAVDHCGSVMRLEWIDRPAEDVARGLMWAWGGEAMRVRPVAVPRRPALRPLMTCVEVAKALLGLPGFGVWTPGQLRRAAVRLGAQAVPPYPKGA